MVLGWRQPRTWRKKNLYELRETNHGPSMLRRVSGCADVHGQQRKPAIGSHD
jgi:hypothetical protein